MADVSSFTDILVISRGSRAKLLILLSLVVLAASLIEEPLMTSKDEKAALEDQEESANHHHFESSTTDIHPPATSGSSKQDSLFHRAERAIKETMSSVKGKLSDGEESAKSDPVTGGVEAVDVSVPSTLKKAQLDDKSSDESDESSEEKKSDDDWYNKQIKESLKETMERATGNADPSVEKSIKSVEESMVKAASGFVDRIETAFSSIIEQLHLHSEPQPAVEEAGPEAASTGGEVDPNAIPFDTVPVAEEKESMYEHLKKRVTGLFSYQEEKDENSFLMTEDQTLSDVTLPEDRVAL